MSALRVLVCLLGASALHPLSARAQTPWGATPIGAPGYSTPLSLATATRVRTEVVDLGAGMSAERTSLCVMRGYGTEQCSQVSWRPVGFAFGARLDLQGAQAFAGDGRGRVVASTEHDMVYTDDRGQSWQHCGWNGVHRPQVVVIDLRSRFGVAAADGAVHVTDDGGATWRFLREFPSRRISRAAVSGTNAALADDLGSAWALVHGDELSMLGGSVTAAPTLGPYDPRARIEVRDGAIVVADARGQVFVIGRDGVVRRP